MARSGDGLYKARRRRRRRRRLGVENVPSVFLYALFRIRRK